MGYERLRVLTYHRTDVFVVTFQFGERRSLENVPLWHEEIKNRCPDAPIILLGLKSDLRQENSG